MAQRWKHLPGLRETWVRSLGREDPLEKEMATHSSTLAWKIPWREEPGRLQSMGSLRVGHNWVTSLHQATRKGLAGGFFTTGATWEAPFIHNSIQMEWCSNKWGFISSFLQRRALCRRPLLSCHFSKAIVTNLQPGISSPSHYSNLLITKYFA